jgi:hypothetical protein
MQALIINETVEKYPYSIGALRRDNPQVSFPKNPSTELLESYGVYNVEITEQPIYSPPIEKIEEGTPVLIEGKWKQKWEIIPLSDDEKLQFLENLKNSIGQQTQERLDSFARTREYDGILSACTYASSSVEKFMIEALYCIDVRDQTWAKLYEIMSEVEQGIRPIPSDISDIESELPELAWPN